MSAPQADSASYHVPAMAREALEYLDPRPGQIMVDATLGGGGHARLLRERIGPDGLLIGIDQDAEAIAAATAALEANGAAGRARFVAVQARFDALGDVLASLGIEAVDGVLFDLGVSSHQLDDARRGFSFKEPRMALDMRMNASPAGGATAAEVLADGSREELTRIFREYADERWAARIAEFVVRERDAAPIETVGDLTGLIKRAVPAGARQASGIHPATRIFQALRIAVNDEYAVLERGLAGAIEALRSGADARVVAIAYHSGEDRIVKRMFQEWAGLGACRCPPEQPVCTCRKAEADRKARILTRKPVAPTPEEVARNPRARSAKLRAAQRT